MKKKSTSTKKADIKKIHHRVKLALIPHHKNQFRPHLTRRYGILAVLFLVVGVQIGSALSNSTAVLGSNDSITVDSLLQETNKQRVEQNLKPLKINKQLSEAASLKANDMFAKQYWAHTAPDGTEPWQWFKKASYNYNYAGENLAKNFVSSNAVTTAWMSSPEHRANILNSNYSEVGFAVASGELNGQETNLVVAMYGEPASSAIAGKNNLVTTAPSVYPIGVLERIGIAVQSMNPATIGTLLVLTLAAIVAAASHLYRHRLPKHFRQSWYRHHGAYKAAGMFSLAIAILSLYSGGQI